jgi:phytoene desaturase
MEGPEVSAGMRAVIVGGGLGGLAVALRLRAAGWDIIVCDNGPTFGGKMNRWEAAGYRFDTGPTLLTMPEVLRRLYQDVGERLEEHLELEALDPHAEYIYPDGLRLLVPARWEAWRETARRLTPGDVAGLDALHRLGERIFRLSEDTFFRNHPLAARVPPLGALRNLPLRHAWGSYARTVERFIKNEYLRRIFLRYPTYVGSSPYLCPAMLLVIPYLEHAFGAWYVKGGMYRIIESLLRLARARGVELLAAAEAVRIEHNGRRVLGVRLRDGRRIEAEVVIFNGDGAALASLLGTPGPPRPERRSLSGFVLLLGLREKPAGLSHHTVVFSADYRAEFDALFGERRFPDDPTVYVNAPSDAALAPPGGQALFLMANAPGDGAQRWDRSAVAEARRRIFERLRSAGFDDLERRAEVCEVWHPARFAERYLAPGGAIYGDNSHGWRRAFLRPPNRSRRFAGLYCTGGSFHPGGGVPMVLLSAQITAGLVLEDAERR